MNKIADDIFAKHLTVEYHEWLRQFPCVICMQRNPDESIDISHIKAVGMGRNRRKAMMNHFLVLPKCNPHHREFEAMILSEFEKKYNINIWKSVATLLAKFLWMKAQKGGI